MFLKNPPPGVISVSVSPDGKKIFWLSEEKTKSYLIVRDLKSNNERILVAHSGQISKPSWSPDSSQIAYYYVESELKSNDAYELYMITLGESGDEPNLRKLAPASKQSALTASRTQPPLWSSDGTQLKFVANYESDELIKSYSYIIHLETNELKRVESGEWGSIWNSDGNALLLVQRESLSSKNYVISRYNLSSFKVNKFNLPFQIPSNITNCLWHPNGQNFAFNTTDNELIIVDLVTQKKVNVLKVNGYARMYWLNLESKQGH